MLCWYGITWTMATCPRPCACALQQADGGSLSCESQRLWRERIHAKGASAATLAGGGPAYEGLPRGSGTCSPFLHETYKTHRLDKREANVRRPLLTEGRGEQ